MTAIRLLFCVFAFTATAALAATPYVPLEQRLSTEQLRETGIDTLSAEQLKKLNAILADALAQDTAPAPVAPAGCRRCVSSGRRIQPGGQAIARLQ